MASEPPSALRSARDEPASSEARIMMIVLLLFDRLARLG
jgi:hypothetical protein